MNEYKLKNKNFSYSNRFCNFLKIMKNYKAILIQKNFNILKFKNMEKFIKSKIDYIIHIAGLSGLNEYTR